MTARKAKAPQAAPAAPGTELSTCAIRLKAADILAEAKWTRGAYYDHKRGAYCLMGAVRKALTGSPFAPSLHLYAVCESMGFGQPWRAESWNDKKGRTKREVIARLKKGCQS